VLWAKAKEKGMNVAVNCQDADSSSAKGFRYSYHDETESKIMLCAGHVGRAHGNKLQDLQRTDLRVDAWDLDLSRLPSAIIFVLWSKLCQYDNKQRMVKLENKKTLEGKRQRIQLKVNRVEEQKIRKRYTKSCQIRHTYGEDDDEQVLEEVLLRLTERAIEDGTAPTLQLVDSAVLAPEGATVSIGGKRCKSSGSTSHMRSSHKDCPNNKTKKNTN
ncbi:hypothetical protein QZH41_010260, partial [Actinostola sp. cb2023]